VKLDTRILIALAAAFPSLACVTTQRYDEANAQAKYYQRLYQDAEAASQKREARIAAMERELDLLRAGGPSDASYTREIDERLAELAGIMGGLSETPGDVEMLSVEGGYGMRMSDAILFDSGSDQIRASGRELLLRLGREIAARPYERVWVRGHTDSDPVKRSETRQKFPHGNLQLSAERAIEVAALLTGEGGLDSKRVIVAGFGPNEPVVRNDSAGNKQRNRRVEIFVIQDGAVLRGAEATQPAPAGAQDGAR
jgi:flagellar motor protein MotB